MSIILKILCFCSFLLIYSCKESSSSPKESNEIEFIKLHPYMEGINEPKILDIQFDDLIIYKNKYTSGKIIYDIRLDSLESSEINNRYIMFYATTEKRSLPTLESIKKNASFGHMDTIINGIFNFKLKFSSDKNSLLRVAIVDKIFLEGDGTSKKMEVLQNTILLELPIFVLDSTNVVGIKEDTIYFTGEKTIKIKRKDSARFAKENQRRIDSIKKF